jgi:hypothetical protein
MFVQATVVIQLPNSLNTVMFLPHGKDLTIASAFFGTAASLA